MSLNVKLCSPKQLSHFGRAVAPIYQAKASVLGCPPALKIACVAHQNRYGPAPRSFSTTSRAQLKDFFPSKETGYIRQTPPAWRHHGWTEKEMLSVVAEHRTPKTLGDKAAWYFVRTCK